MTPAISSTCAARPSKVVVPSCSIRSALAPSLNTGPGAIVLIRTPDGLNSAAQARLIAVSAALVAPYAALPSRPTFPTMLSRLMMLPFPRAAIPGASAATSW